MGHAGFIPSTVCPMNLQFFRDPATEHSCSDRPSSAHRQGAERHERPAQHGALIDGIRIRIGFIYGACRNIPTHRGRVRLRPPTHLLLLLVLLLLLLLLSLH